LNNYLNLLIKNSPEHAEFAQRVLLLSKEFRLSDIKKLLQTTLEKLNHHE